MASARVRLNGRYGPGDVVRCYEVASERVLRPGPADRLVGSAVVDEDGRVEFEHGVRDGGRYILQGQHRGSPLEVRCRGRLADDPAVVLEVPPVGEAARRFSDGSLVDPVPAVAVAAAEKQEAPARRYVSKSEKEKK